MAINANMKNCWIVDESGIRVSSDNIVSLAKDEVFVFGSNPNGRHNGGAARQAYQSFGAKWGVGNGPTGRCYAIPTMGSRNIEVVASHINNFIVYASEHPEQKFLVTRIGCGVAKFRPEQIAPCFARAAELDNVFLPEEFWQYIQPVKIELGGEVPDAHYEDGEKDVTREDIYIMDTNVFVNNPTILSKIESKYKVVIPVKVIQELDKFKRDDDKKKRENAQKALKSIVDYTEGMGITAETTDTNLLPPDFSKASPDNKIIAVAMKHLGENTRPIIVTDDNGLKLGANAVSIDTIRSDEFEKKVSVKNTEKFKSAKVALKDVLGKEYEVFSESGFLWAGSFKLSSGFDDRVKHGDRIIINEAEENQDKKTGGRFPFIAMRVTVLSAESDGICISAK